MILILLTIELNQVSSFAQTTNAPPQVQSQAGPHPQLIFECVFAMCVLAVGGYMVVKLYQCAKKNLPPTPPPPPPPPPPTNAPPPITNHIVIRPMDDGPPPFPTNDPPCTNCPPDTNVYVPPAPYYWIPQAWSSLTNQIVTNSATDGGNYYDISGQGYMDSNATPATPWFGFISDTLSNVQSSTDLVTWSNYTYNIWLSSNGTETVVYDGSGYPVITNYDYGDTTQGGPTNATQIQLGIWINNGEEPHKFFRVLASP
jgi:hypothetical protein